MAKKLTSGCLRSFNEPTVGEEEIWRMNDSEVGGRERREGEKKGGACVSSVSLHTTLKQKWGGNTCYVPWQLR